MNGTKFIKAKVLEGVEVGVGIVVIPGAPRRPDKSPTSRESHAADWP